MDQEQVQQTLKKGILAARRNKIEPAQRLLTQVVQADPDNEEAWMWLSRVVSQPEQKAECLRRVLDLNPENQWAVEQLGALHSSSAPSEPETLFEAESDSTAQPPLEPVSAGYEFELLKCPNCGSNYEIRGGAQTKTVVCDSCGSVLDLTAEQATVIGQANEKGRAMVPVKLGMEGTIDNVLYQVIGWIRYEGWDDEDRWRWDEWLLASADGEFRWLSYDPEAGFILQKKIPLTGPIDYNRTTAIPVPDGQAPVSERSPAKIIALAGELTWRAKVGDHIHYMEAKKGDTLYSVEISADEVELLAGKAIPEEAVWQSFGNQPMLEAMKGIGEKRSSFRLLAMASMLFLILSCVCSLFASASGTSLFKQNVKLTRGEAVTVGPFNVNASGRIHEITLSTDSPSDSWGTVSIDSLDSQGNKAFLFSKVFGKNDGSITHKFKPGAEGEHNLIITLKDGQLITTGVTVEIKGGIWSGGLLMVFAVVCIILGIIFWVMSSGSRPPYSHTIESSVDRKA